MQDAIDIKVLQTLSHDRERHGYRSAGACPPRTTDLGGKRPQPRVHGRSLLRSARGEGQALPSGGKRGVLGAVARGPVPRDP